MSDTIEIDIEITLKQVMIAAFLAGILTGFSTVFAFNSWSPQNPIENPDTGIQDEDQFQPPNTDSKQPDTETEEPEKANPDTETHDMEDEIEKPDNKFNPENFNTGKGEGEFNWDGGTVSLDGKPYIGSEDARFKIITYEDFDCGFCGEHNRNGFYSILENQIQDGEVQYFYKHYNTQEGIGKISDQAVQCALNQDTDSFWEMKDKIYQDQQNLNRGNIDRSVSNYAEEIGLEADEFESCLENEETLDKRQEDQEEAESFDYQHNSDVKFPAGTPAFLLYDTETGNFQTMHGERDSNQINQAINSITEAN